MCIFTGPVRDVSNTKMFARLSGRGTQYLIYQMTYGADCDVAMVLPLPVSCHAEDAVKFIALDGYAEFFDDLEQAFRLRCVAGYDLGVASADRSVLAVHRVGNFEATFVPTLSDFDRLDRRFKLPRQTWEQLPHYSDYGFAVFKLHNDRRGLTDVHPMAFEFPTVLKDVLYFPTVHIHDEKVHPKEQFDHAIYWQGTPSASVKGFRKSSGDLSDYSMVRKSKGILASLAPCYKLSLGGLLLNQDFLLTLEPQSR